MYFRRALSEHKRVALVNNYSGAPRAREARAWAEPHC